MSSDVAAAPLPRLVATDLDGTLLGANGEVSARTREVLDELDRRGVPVVFVTGRPVRWMDAMWEAVGGHGLAICSNGAIEYDVSSHSIRRAHTIDVKTLWEVGALLRQQIPGTTFALERTSGFAREADFFEGLNLADVPEVPIGTLEEISDDTVVKLLARHRDVAPEPFWDRAEQAVGDLVTTTWSSMGALVEMSATGITKASTLEVLCTDLGIEAHEVVAFGDMPNDLPMLAWAGTSYAMANAHRSVLELATHTAGRHDEDGVAATLTELFEL